MNNQEDKLDVAAARVIRLNKDADLRATLLTLFTPSFYRQKNLIPSKIPEVNSAHRVQAINKRMRFLRPG